MKSIRLVSVLFCSMRGANNVASTSDGTTTCTRSYNPANQLTTETCSGSTETFVYDANGNLAEDADYVYHWDFLNRLVHVEAKVGMTHSR